MVNNKKEIIICSDSNYFNNIVDNCYADDTEIGVIGCAKNFNDLKRYAMSHKNFIVIFFVKRITAEAVYAAGAYLKSNDISFITVCEDSLLGFDTMKNGSLATTTWKENRDKLEDQRLMRNLRMKIKDAFRIKEANMHRQVSSSFTSYSNKLIVIGASTGGTEAVLEILRNLPAEMPPILVVQHMPAGFTRMYAQRLDSLCKLTVWEAKDGDEIKSGLALIAPGNYHMVIAKRGSSYVIKTYQGDKVNGVQPSVDVLFDSVAEQDIKHIIGVILTGMGNDGAKGLLKLKNKGAFTIGQNMESCIVYGMPKAAYELGAVSKQADIKEIARMITEHI